MYVYDGTSDSGGAGRDRKCAELRSARAIAVG